MNRLFLPLLLASLCLLSCLQQPTTEASASPSNYTPRYAEQWDSVYRQVLRTWPESKVDSSTWQMPGSLVLPFPYFSIHSGRNVLFGWDTYFTNAGLLLIDSLAIYAKHAADNQLAEIDQIGFVPNASEPWGHNRPQTPYLAMMVQAVYQTPGLADRSWLNHAYEGLVTEYHFWTDHSAGAIEVHTSCVPGLQRFGHHATQEELLVVYGHIAQRFGFSDTLPEAEKLQIADAWTAEAASGMDYTPRFEHRCPDFIAVDLNSALYAYERVLAWIVEELGLPDEPDWAAYASRRQQLMSEYCWSEERGLFMDYDCRHQRHSQVASAAAFYPLWVGLASEAQAARTVENLPLFEYAFGPAVCERTEQAQTYQWDYPAGWPPIYYLVAAGLDRYGYTGDAKRIAAKYLDLATKNYFDPQPAAYLRKKKGETIEATREPGHIYEKYEVLTGEVYDAEYASRAFHGWSYGVFIWSWHYCRDAA